MESQEHQLGSALLTLSATPGKSPGSSTVTFILTATCQCGQVGEKRYCGELSSLENLSDLMQLVESVVSLYLGPPSSAKLSRA